MGSKMTSEGPINKFLNKCALSSFVSIEPHQSALDMPQKGVWIKPNLKKANFFGVACINLSIYVIHLIQKRLSSELLYCALCIVHCTLLHTKTATHYILKQNRTFDIVPWLIHKCRCLIVGTCNAI